MTGTDVTFARDQATTGINGTRSVGRIALDLASWIGAALLAERIGSPWAVVLAIAWIGAASMHDLLVHGHEAVHGLLARNRALNDFFAWFLHAVVGLSGTAYRVFHLAHHRLTQTAKDPEYVLLARIAKGVPGWAYLGIPAVAHLAVNSYPSRSLAPAAIRRRVLRDLVGMGLLHVALWLVLGPRRYILYVLVPIFTSLSAVVILRSICEHHATDPGSPWTRTRTMDAGRLLDFLWSNTSYHLEHHLYPFVPARRLPALRRRLADTMAERGSPVDKGFLRTALALLLDPRHFRGRRPEAFIDPRSLAFRMKVRWFRDILVHPPARRHLWNLYYAGEAYEELHPNGIFVDRLEAPWAKLLALHLSQETRHATVFRALLARDGLAPAALPPEEDVGWYLLTHVVPDIVTRSRGEGRFTTEEVARYMAFLHTLELRSLSDLAALIEAARGLGETELATSLAGILRDERFHASYTHSAVRRLVGRARGREILDAVRGAERVHYGRVLRCILSRFDALGTGPRDVGGRLRWGTMRFLTALGLAVPLLPLYDRLPDRMMAVGQN